MKVKHLLLFIFFTLSCNTYRSDLYIFDPRALVDNKVTLSEVADDIIYVPLDSKYSIGFINNLSITEKSIFLNSNEGIIALNRRGLMARAIGKKGRGPGEYIYSSTYTVDPQNETVYIKDRNNTIKVYSGNGIFLRDINLSDIKGDIECIVYYNSTLFVSYFLQFGSAEYNWILIDTLGAIISKKKKTIPEFTSNWLAGSGTFQNENHLSYWNPYNDTVFSLFPDLSYKASFLISQGEFRLPEGNINAEREITQYLSIRSLLETNQYLVFIYAYEKTGVIALIEKKSWKSYLSHWQSADSGGILNDFDGGTSFLPKSYFVENGCEYLIGLINTYQLKAHVKTNEFKTFTPIYPEKKKELELLANRLKETDNPVLVMVRLKK